jgi:hypothetical protein
MHPRLGRLACLPALLVLGACGVRPAPEAATLDLGGGISMTATGQILGATPAWRPTLPADDRNLSQDNTATAMAANANPFPPGAPTPLFFSSAAQWFPPAIDQTAAGTLPAAAVTPAGVPAR